MTNQPQPTEVERRELRGKFNSERTRQITESEQRRAQDEAAQRLNTTEREANPEENSSCPAPGSASLPWIAEPTRAGWWWRFVAGNIELCELRMNRRKLMVWNNCGTQFDPAQGWPGRWAGPVEPPPAPDEEPTPNRVINEQELDNA